MDKPRYTLLHPLALSYYSRPLYRDVGRKWTGVGFLYLFLLLGLSWLLWTVELHRKIGDFVADKGQVLIEQIPAVVIEEGRVSVDAPQPHFIEIPDEVPWRMVIDTTGGTTELEEGARILLTASELLVRKSGAETRVYDLSDVKEFRVDQELAAGWLRLLGRWFAVLLFPFVLVLSFAFRIVQILIYAGIGTLFARGLGVALDYQALLRLASVSMTPVILLDTLVVLLGWRIDYWWPICFLIAMGYLFFAVRANAGSANEERYAASSGSDPR